MLSHYAILLIDLIINFSVQISFINSYLILISPHDLISLSHYLNLTYLMLAFT